jgi:hypothetical protein
MSVQARSLGSTGRPVFGRPVAAVVAALIATFAVGVPAALAGETPGSGDPAADAAQTTSTPPPSASPPADPPAVGSPPADTPSGDPPPADAPAADPPSGDPPPADAPPADPPSGDPPPADAPPVDPPPAADSPPADAPATDPPAADPPGPAGPPADSSPGDPPPTQSPSGEPSGPPSGTPSSGDAPTEETPAQPAPPPGGNHAAAQNQSRVIQAVWQVQRGCRTHCHGTSQTQRADQLSRTNQRATAISGESDGGGSSAQARNESSTIQFVWQMQIGCVAFCFHTSQSQEASQQSYTTQEADAQSALAAWAENIAETVQLVFQFQQGCEYECHGVTQHQSSTQGQTTSQSANADALGDGVGFFLVPDWLVAYAQNIGATIQLIYQYQDALCLEYCMGDAQLQEAIQQALTDQNAVALAAPPEPAVPPTGEQPPGGEPPPGPAVIPETTAPAPPAVARSSVVRQGYVLGRNRRRTVRRQELVLRAGAPPSGRGHLAPNGAAPVPTEAGGGSAGGGSTVASVAAELAAGAATVARAASDDDKRDAGAGGEQLPAQTFAMPSVPDDGGSLGWLLVLLLVAAVTAVIGSLRRALATNMTRI